MTKLWNYITLEDVVEKKSSNLSKRKLQNDDGPYPVYGAKGKIKEVSFYDVEKDYLGLIKDGAGVGRVSKHPAKSSLLATLQYLIPKEGYDIDFVKYFLQSIDFQKYVTGSTIPHVYFKNYKNEKFPNVNLKEQERIVAILDEAFDKIDRAQANIEKNIANAEELFQSKLDEVFSQTGEGWEEKSLNKLTKIINGHSFKSGDFCPKNQVRAVKITNVGVKKFVEEDENKLPKHFLDKFSNVMIPKGSIVIALTRTIISNGLKVALVPQSYHNSLLNQRVAAIVPNEEILSQKFIFAFLCTSKVQNYVLDNVNTLMQPNLSIRDLRSLPVPVPSLKIQEEINTKITTLENLIKKFIQIKNRSNNNLKDFKKSILQKAFSGSLTASKILS